MKAQPRPAPTLKSNMSMAEELVSDFEYLLRKRSVHESWKRLGLVEIDISMYLWMRG